MISAQSVRAQSQSTLTLEQAISQALLDDDWLLANEQRESSLREEAIFAGQLPDPRMTVGLVNLPVNTLDFNQENMTMFRVGINQSFPRGDSLELGQQQKIQQSEIYPFLRADRRANVQLEVTDLWLDTFLAQESITLINNDRAFFELLVEITDSRYRTAAGLSRQQDVVRAQLELTRLDDRLASLRQRVEGSKQQLAQWLPYEWLSLPLSQELPDLSPPDMELSNLAQAAQVFINHPGVRALDKQIEAAFTNVELARQSYKPAFSLGANYGYRGSGPMGLERADFFSLDVSFDLPFFTEKRQKPKVEAASYSASAAQTDRIILFKSLFANYQQAMSQLVVLDERKAFFDDILLIQMGDLTEATLAAYTSDAGSFEEVMRANIAELNARIEVFGIEVERLKMIARLNYLLTDSTD